MHKCKCNVHALRLTLIAWNLKHFSDKKKKKKKKYNPEKKVSISIFIKMCVENRIGKHIVVR